MDSLKIGELFAKLKPRFIDLISTIGGGTGPFAPTPHDLNSAHHTGTIADAQATQFIMTDGSRLLTGNQAVADGITIDGVDISAHAVDISAHHEPVTVLDSESINFGLSGQQVTGDVLPAGVDHDSLNNFVANKHIDHSLVSVISGNGLTGGGDLTADRTLAVGAGLGISVGADIVSIDQAANLTWTGTHIFQGELSTRHILPELTDTYDLGSSTMLWRKGWLSELDTVLFAKNTMTLLGGWFTIGKGEGALPADVGSTDSSIDFGQAMTPDHFVVFRSSLQMEYMQVGTLVSGTTYNVTRDLDGSGANDWVSGSIFLILGTTGDGRLELNAYDSPRIQIIEQGATYNAQTERLRIGDLNGNWGYSSAVHGLAIGEYANNKPNLTIDPTNGLRIRNYSTDVLTFDTSGNANISNKLKMAGASSAIAIGSTPPTAADAGTGIWIDRTGYYGLASGTYQVKIDATDGVLYAGAGNVVLDESGIVFSCPANSPLEANTIKWKDDAGYTWASIASFTMTNSALMRINIDRKSTVAAAGLEINFLDDGSYVGAGLFAFWQATDGTMHSLMREIEYLDIEDGYLMLGYEGLLAPSSPQLGDIYAAGSIYAAGDVRATGDFISYKNSTEYNGYLYVPLQTPLTSTSFDGDARSTTAKTKIDLSSVFSVPAGVKAVSVYWAWHDSGSAGTNCWLCLSPNSTNAEGKFLGAYGLANDKRVFGDATIPCDANGDIYFQINASGEGTFDLWIQIWGYYL